ncbi:MAG: acyl carrier protein [Lentisphaerae bacterium]|nr:acyl carrier protein [Lentisphaerota bacterium]
MAETWTRERVLADLLELVTDMTRDFEIDFEGGITPESRFGADLEFESTDVVELVGEIETRFKRRHIPFDKLILKDGRYADFSIRELADFLHQELNTPPA